MHSPLPSVVTRSIASLHEARTARATRRQLCAELDSYRSEAERAELDAILARHTHRDLEVLSAMTGRRYAA